MFCFWFSVANDLRTDQHTHLTGMFWMVFSFDQSKCGQKDPLLTHVLTGTKELSRVLQLRSLCYQTAAIDAHKHPYAHYFLHMYIFDH